MKKLPNKITISGIEWKIIIEKSSSDVDVDKRSALWGQTDHWNKVIRIHERGESAMALTFFHELLHALFTKSNYDKHSEDEVEQLAKSLFDTLNRNNLLK